MIVIVMTDGMLPCVLGHRRERQLDAVDEFSLLHDVDFVDFELQTSVQAGGDVGFDLHLDSVFDRDKFFLLDVVEDQRYGTLRK